MPYYTFEGSRIRNWMTYPEVLKMYPTKWMAKVMTHGAPTTRFETIDDNGKAFQVLLYHVITAVR